MWSNMPNLDVNSAASSLFGNASNPSELFAKTDTTAMFNSFKEMAEKGLAEISAAATSALDADGDGDANNMLFAEGGVVVPQKDVPAKRPASAVAGGPTPTEREDGSGLHSRQAFDEEISRVKDLVKAKDGELAKLSAELQDARDVLQAEKLAQVALRKELKDTKATDKAAAAALDAKIAALDKEVAQLRDAAEKHQKVAADRAADADSLRKQLEAATTELKNYLKTAKAAEKTLKDGYEDKVSALERDNADLRDEVSNLRKTVDDRNAALTALQGQLSEAGKRIASEADSQDANVTQLQQERTAARVEAAQHLEQLKQAQEAVTALEKKLEKSKSLYRKLEDKLKASERDRQVQEDEAATAAAEAAERAAAAADRVKALEAELAGAHTAQDAAQGMADKLRAEMAESATKAEALAAALAKAEEGLEEERAQAAATTTERDDLLGRLRSAEAEVAQLKSIAETLQEARGKQSSETMSMAAKMDELALKVKKAEDATAAEKANAAAVAAERDTIKASLAGKEETVNELQGKLAHLAEKLKDVMKKYAEAKASLQSVEQGKESELMSLRLKLDNAERGTGDQRAMAAELADRYGETQRELSRAKTAVQEHLLTIESLQRDLRTSEENASLVANEKMGLLDKLRQQEDARVALERRVGELMDERERVEDKLRSEEDSAKVLEEYKKRAQLALKKANTASSQAAAEVGEMRQNMEEAQARAADAEEAAARANEQFRSMQAERDEAVALATQLKKDHAAAVEAEQVAAAAAAQALARLRDANEALAARPAAAPAAPVAITPQVTAATAEPAQSATSVQTHESSGNGNDDENPAAMKKPPPSAPSSSSGTGSSRRRRQQSPEDDASNDDDDDDEAEADEGAAPSRSRSRTSQVRGAQQPPARWNEPDNDTIEFGSGVSLPIKKPSSDKLVFVNELYSQIDELRREVTHRGLEIDACRQELSLEVEAKKKLATRVEELMAFLDRSKKFQQNDPDSATNTEYLKNCVYRFMATTEFSERRRLAPVISTILKLTTQEKKAIEAALVASESNDIGSIGTMASTMATSTFGGLLGWGNAASLLWDTSEAPAALPPADSSLPVPGLGLRRGTRNSSS